MRTVIFLTIVGVVFASDEPTENDICHDEGVSQAEIEHAKSIARFAAASILGWEKSGNF